MMGSRSLTTEDGRLGVRSSRPCKRSGEFFGESALPREDFIEHQAERVDVAPRADFFARKLLGRHVGRSAAANFGSADFVGDPSQPEVGDDDLTTAVEHDVGRLQVAMKNSLGVGGGETCAKLACDLDGFVLRKAADAAQEGCEIFAVDVLHGEECLAFDVAYVIDAADVRMGNAAGDADFVAEALEQCLRRWRAASGKKFERDSPDRA